MKHICNVRAIALIMVLLSAAVAISVKSLPSASGAQREKTYVLTTAGPWAAERGAALSGGGREGRGSVISSNRLSGIGMATPTAADFLDRVQAINQFTSVAADQVVQWQQPPTQTVELEEATATPGNETFINLQWNLRAIEG